MNEEIKVDEEVKDHMNPGGMILPEICIAKGYDSLQAENGEMGFGVYIPSEKQIYVAGDIPKEWLLKSLFHEIAHWVQDVSGKKFEEDEADEFAERLYASLPDDMLIDWTSIEEKPNPDINGPFLATVVCGEWERPRVMEMEWKEESGGWLYRGMHLHPWWAIVAWRPMPKAYLKGVLCGWAFEEEEK